MLANTVFFLYANGLMIGCFGITWGKIMIKLYGIKQCDSVRKAIKALENQQIEFEFIDLKTTQLSLDLLKNWLVQCPETLINKRSTTYRTIKEPWLACEGNVGEQLALIQGNPTVIKRPVLLKNNQEIIVGFDKTIYQSLF